MQINLVCSYYKVDGPVICFEIKDIIFKGYDDKKYHSSWSMQNFMMNENFDEFQCIGKLESVQEIETIDNSMNNKNISLSEFDIFSKEIDEIELFYYDCEFKDLKINSIVVKDNTFKKTFSLEVKKCETTKRFSFK